MILLVQFTNMKNCILQYIIIIIDIITVSSDLIVASLQAVKL